MNSMYKNKLVRLNKFISNSGLCTRREADEYIKKNYITVNDQLVNTLGVKVKLSDIVKFKNERIMPYETKYILLNKPKGFYCIKSKAKNIFSLISKADVDGVLKCLIPLKSNYSGLILISNHFLKKEKKQSYLQIFHLKLENEISKNELNIIKRENAKSEIKIQSINHIEADTLNEIGIELYIGKDLKPLENLFEKKGNKVVFLDRVYFENLTKKDLPRGKWRLLRERKLII
mgnify:FL=1